eukprot:TRINITY_DN2582_c0_g1_i1.p5 TRINITY_DN2582_c0_g1~~TRINITY_DN2582_c0_g1_i1.p5  ORF type:complete len:101 (-),score=9.46 TRINITY_DN2582_c0_g1_i1:224-526(-)
MGCRNLGSIELCSSFLENVQLAGDKMLQRVLFQNCQNLQFLDLTNCQQLRDVGIEYVLDRNVALKCRLQGCLNLDQSTLDFLKSLRVLKRSQSFGEYSEI